jgi:hypothetical protein
MTFFPARPINGGRLEDAPSIPDGYDTTPKLDGWRLCVNVQTLLAGEQCCWNRHGEPLSIEDKFKDALAQLKKVVDPEWVWVDAEGLANRHAVARGTLVILDFVPKVPKRFRMTYAERRKALLWGDKTHGRGIPIAPWNPEKWKTNTLYLIPSITGDPIELYNRLKTLQPLYEGIVRKKLDSIYPFGKSATDDTPFWQKHRFDK